MISWDKCSLLSWYNICWLLGSQTFKKLKNCKCLSVACFSIFLAFVLLFYGYRRQRFLCDSSLPFFPIPAAQHRWSQQEWDVPHSSRLPAMGQQAPTAGTAFITPCFTGGIALLGTTSASSRAGAQVAWDATFFRGNGSPFYQASWY